MHYKVTYFMPGQLISTMVIGRLRSYHRVICPSSTKTKQVSPSIWAGTLLLQAFLPQLAALSSSQAAPPSCLPSPSPLHEGQAQVSVCVCVWCVCVVCMVCAAQKGTCHCFSNSASLCAWLCPQCPVECCPGTVNVCKCTGAAALLHSAGVQKV